MKISDLKENIKVLEDIICADMKISKKAKEILKLEATTHNLNEIDKIIKEYKSLLKSSLK